MRCRQWWRRRIHQALRLPLQAHRLRGWFLGRLQRLEDCGGLQEETAGSLSPPLSDWDHFRKMVRPPVPRRGHGEVRLNVRGESNSVETKVICLHFHFSSSSLTVIFMVFWCRLGPQSFGKYWWNLVRCVLVVRHKFTPSELALLCLAYFSQCVFYSFIWNAWNSLSNSVGDIFQLACLLINYHDYFKLLYKVRYGKKFTQLLMRLLLMTLFSLT